MIPMRDGVKLHTVILLPKGAQATAADPPDPHALRRRRATTSHAHSSHLAPDLNGLRQRHRRHRRGGYIRVMQDIRGKYGSEGDYVMNRPLARPAEPDTRRRIHRHLRHHRLAREERPRVQRQGRRILGISYDGFLPLMAPLPSAPRAQGLRPHEPHGRWLDGRRLVPQRRLPRTEHALHPRAGRHARQHRSSGGRPLRRLRHLHAAGSAGELGARARPRPDRLLEQGHRASRATTPSGSDQAMDKLLGDASR